MLRPRLSAASARLEIKSLFGGVMSRIKQARIKSQTLGSRLSGVSLFGFGASWKAPEPERDVVRSVINVLEDRRALYVDFELEIEDQVNDSLVQIRKVLTDGITRVSDSSPAAEAFRIMRAACREFLTQPHSNPLLGRRVGRHARSEDKFFAALGKLRGVFGQQRGLLGYPYRIDVEKQ